MIFFPRTNKFVSFYYLSSRNDDLEISVDRSIIVGRVSLTKGEEEEEGIVVFARSGQLSRSAYSLNAGLSHGLSMPCLRFHRQLTIRHASLCRRLAVYRLQAFEETRRFSLEDGTAAHG